MTWPTAWPTELPIVQAPMAGGPSTPGLTAAVSAAGGYGFLAAGYLSADGLRDLIAETRTLTESRFGVNLFVPSSPGNPDEVRRYGSLLEPEAERLGVALGEPRWEDDGFEEKLNVVESAHVDLMSFTFGCPTPAMTERLQRAGSRVAVTVTSVAEARVASEVGADLLAVQGTEAGGHQGSFLELEPNRRPLLSLLAEIRDVTDVPLVGTGGIMTGTDAAAALGAGAVAVMVGTALLCAAEAGTAATYRRALLDKTYADTMVTRAFSGRYARGLANEFAQAHTDQAPQAYPEVHHLTRPLRAAAMKAGDPSVPNLWAGKGWRQLTAEAAGTIVRRIATEARAASRRTAT
ncbi:MAG TPA: nitronate monooxygenase [Acidimicrobiales bacterium]|jgi:nitronate monooxygenase|nr:nitronate monooxygenase [Acidimicrobiales bacterium]